MRPCATIVIPELFEKEDLNTILDFLKESKNFNYKTEAGDTITITLSK